MGIAGIKERGDLVTKVDYGLIGETLGHSYSPEIHAQLGDYSYKLLPMDKKELDVFLKNREFKGVNITIPYKEFVIDYLDEISSEASSIGAVNTVVNLDGKLYGTNTDYYGMKALINRIGINLNGSKVLILGTGGTSKTAATVVKNGGAKEFTKVSRTDKFNAITYSKALEQKDTDIIINTTPVGMFPELMTESPIILDCFSHLKGVVDVVYNPLRTELVLTAQEKNIPSAGGLYMLVMQAIYSAELFMDKSIDKNIAYEIYHQLRAKLENIVLIGMPSSGKTTLGKAIARQSNREFIDTDELIYRKIGKRHDEIIVEEGESAFRKIESEIISTLRSKTGAVIATGGGSILNRNNQRSLLANGRCYFLDRPLEDLSPTEDRPLTSTQEDLEKRYRERLPIYNKLAYKKIAIDSEPEVLAKRILKEHMG